MPPVEAICSANVCLVRSDLLPRNRDPSVDWNFRRWQFLRSFLKTNQQEFIEVIKFVSTITFLVQGMTKLGHFAICFIKRYLLKLTSCLWQWMEQPSLFVSPAIKWIRQIVFSGQHWDIYGGQFFNCGIESRRSLGFTQPVVPGSYLGLGRGLHLRLDLAWRNWILSTSSRGT